MRILRRGLSLIEVLVAAVILAIVGVGVLQIFSTSTTTIQAADARTAYGFYLQTILRHVQSQSLHPLWDNYGPEEVGPPRPLLGRLALLDDEGNLAAPEDPRANPLGLPQSFLDELRRTGLDARLSFSFFTREELGVTSEVDEDGRTRTAVGSGLLHMQAGWVEITLLDLGDEEVLATIRQPIICPQIVGKPGIKLSSCPAVNPRVRCTYQPMLAEVEGYEWTPEDLAACQRILGEPE
jgi:prepilin-type N-terminal cleavage/methylation domain-containing protein